MCGQFCVAMLAGVGVLEVLLVMGRGGATLWRHRRRALVRLGLRCGPTRRVRSFEEIPSTGRHLVRIRRWDGGGHCVVATRRSVFDPALPREIRRRDYARWAGRQGAAPTSYVTVERRKR